MTIRINKLIAPVYARVSIMPLACASPRRVIALATMADPQRMACAIINTDIIVWADVFDLVGVFIVLYL